MNKSDEVLIQIGEIKNTKSQPYATKAGTLTL